MTRRLHLTLYGGNLPSKKNNKSIAFNRKTRRPFILSSPEYSQWHKQAMLQAIQWKIAAKGNGFELPINRCKLSVYFFFPDNRHRDLDNKLSSILDLLVDSGLILSDIWQVVRPIKIDGGISKTTPRTEIYISYVDDVVKSR